MNLILRCSFQVLNLRQICPCISVVFFNVVNPHLLPTPLSSSSISLCTPQKNSTNAINLELENYLFLQNQKRTLIFDKSFLVNSEKVDRTEFVERQWEFVNLSPGCSLFFAPFETDKFKCVTGANTNAKEFVEEQEVLAICLWRDDVSLWAGSSIRSWQAFTRIQQAAMINLPQVSQAWSFFDNFPN